MKIIYHNDAGHGWYAVKRDRLKAMGLLDKVSAFSYQRGNTVYLEEDCDASLFFDALEDRGSVIVVGSYQDRSAIRGYDRFTLEEGE